MKQLSYPLVRIRSWCVGGRPYALNHLSHQQWAELSLDHLILEAITYDRCQIDSTFLFWGWSG